MITWKLAPDPFRTGVAIVLSGHGETSDVLPSEVTVVPLAAPGADPFTLRLTPRGKNTATSEFTVLIPGTYEIRTGASAISVLVHEQKNLSFDKEFGLWAVLVSLTLIAVLVWNKKHRLVQS